MGDIDGAFKEYGPEFEDFEFDESEWSGEGDVFSEAEVMELAGDLLEVDSEAELDQFLGSLIRRAGRSFGRVIRSPFGRTIGRLLKAAAKKALPLAGAAVGGYVGGPLGAKIGSGLASAAGGALGLEAETLNAEDQEFEGAKQFVRMSGAAVKSALAAAPNLDPAIAAERGVHAAAEVFAPSLASAMRQALPTKRGGKSGQWVRKGQHVVLLNF